VRVHAPVQSVFEAARDVERWPEILSHYRWVRRLESRGDSALVEMAAWRPFGRIKYPTWWVSEMWIEPSAIRYRHVQGITTGMDVLWRVEPAAGATDVTIIHEWSGPSWPVVGPTAATWIIGPVFVHGIASRTLEGMKRHVERSLGVAGARQDKRGTYRERQ
jgi:hypothetical protein